VFIAFASLGCIAPPTCFHDSDRTSTNLRIIGFDSCTTPGLNWNRGAFFEQAFWEILNDVNCSSSNCVFAVEGPFNGTGAIGWTSANQANTVLVRALGHALAATGYSGNTYPAMETHIRAWMLGEVPAIFATKAHAIFQHHGLP
jgi:hypothetical protein